MKESRDACLFRPQPAFAARGSPVLLLGFLSSLFWAPTNLSPGSLSRLSTFGLRSDQSNDDDERELESGQFLKGAVACALIVSSQPNSLAGPFMLGHSAHTEQSVQHTVPLTSKQKMESQLATLMQGHLIQTQHRARSTFLCSKLKQSALFKYNLYTFVQIAKCKLFTFSNEG